MINADHISAILRRRYPDLEPVTDQVFRGVDVHEGRPYAIRYFDLRDDLGSTSQRLRDYQDSLLGPTYYERDAQSDLRWNYYLYFIVDRRRLAEGAFLRAKTLVEADREYARKIVISDNDIESFVQAGAPIEESPEELPPDPLSIWTDVLDEHLLGFVVDESLQVPAVVRLIADGSHQGLRRAPAQPQLEPAESAASSDFLARLEIEGFRECPVRKVFDLGVVNLVSGVNGVGKTSFLEAIEYLFCKKTKRAETPVLRGTIVRGTWAGSRSTLETSVSTRPDKLRARHLAWYGKAELRRLTLDDSFGKFNFLDTDAAVRLTLDSSQSRLSEDLMLLLLGSESAKALDRLTRVSRQLEDNRRHLETEIGAKDERRLDSLARIEALHKVPHESDHLYGELTASLAGLGWIHPPEGKTDTTELGDALQGALTNVRLLQTTSGSLPRTRDELDAVETRLEEAVSRLQQVSERESQLRVDVAAIRTRLPLLERKLEDLDQMSAIVRSGVMAKSIERDSLQQRLAEVSTGLTEAEASIAELPEELDRRQTTLAKAITEWVDQLDQATSRFEQVRQELAALERVQAVVTTELQRLRSAALELMQHTGNETHCPLCRSEFAEHELRLRIDETTQDVGSTESDRLRSEMQEAESARSRRASELVALRALQSFAHGEHDAAVTSVVETIAGTRDQVAELGTELSVVARALQAQEEMGWSVSRFTELAAATGLSDVPPSLKSLEEARRATTAEQEALVASLSALDSEQLALATETRELAVATGAPQAQTPVELSSKLTARIESVGDLRKATQALETQLRPLSTFSDAEVAARLNQAHELLIQLRTAVGRERESDEVIVRETKLVEDVVAEIAALRVKLKRVEIAREVIDDLLKSQSDRVLAEQVLRENAAAIASTFSKLHAPNEFDVSVDDGLQIVRRSSGKSIDLDQMSSGQRTAYALSLFLAMNGRIRSGPRVLLFDDPISHVDDINSLSFLDHLRDIALTGQRQIFFATADAKLAALFAHKFSFFGNERFKQLELTREDVDVES